MAPTGGRMQSVILCFSFLVVFLPCSAYRKYNVGLDKVCSHVKKQTLKLGPPENGILITEERTFDKWSGFKEFRCKFKVELQDEGDLFVVIQNLRFRKDPVTGECIDYIQFTGDDKIRRTEKICGTVNAMKRLYGNAVQSYSDTTPIAFVDPDGEISVEVYVANEPLSSNSEELTLTLAFTQTIPCHSRNSFACSDDKCIPVKFRLDGIVNCPYGSCLDEACTFGGTDVTPPSAPASSSSRASPYDRPPTLPETDETKVLSTTELHRLVLLEQLKLTRMQMEKEALLMNFLKAKMNNVNNVQEEENENSFNVSAKMNDVNNVQEEENENSFNVSTVL